MLVTYKYLVPIIGSKGKIQFSSVYYTNSQRTEDFIWLDNKLIGKCRYGFHTLEEVPHEDCTCGIYGLSNLESVIEQYGDDKHTKNRTILVTVGQYGKFLEGSTGVRSSEAEILSIVPDICGCLKEKVTKLVQFYYPFPAITFTPGFHCIYKTYLLCDTCIETHILENGCIISQEFSYSALSYVTGLPIEENAFEVVQNYYNNKKNEREREKVTTIAKKTSTPSMSFVKTSALKSKKGGYKVTQMTRLSPMYQASLNVMRDYFMTKGNSYPENASLFMLDEIANFRLNFKCKEWQETLKGFVYNTNYNNDALSMLQVITMYLSCSLPNNYDKQSKYEGHYYRLVKY